MFKKSCQSVSYLNKITLWWLLVQLTRSMDHLESFSEFSSYKYSEYCLKEPNYRDEILSRWCNTQCLYRGVLTSDINMLYGLHTSFGL